MNVFLTGASGYIGRHIALELVSRGHAVTGLARKPSSRTNSLPEVRWCFSDLADHATYQDALMSSDAVVHCAMDYSASGENAELDREFVDRLAEYQGHLVYTGNLFSHRTMEVLTESPVADSTHWRFQAEEAVLGRGKPSAAIRLGFVYGGSGGYFWDILSPGTLAGLADESIPDVLWPMIHVADVASLYVRVVESVGTGVYHAFDGARVHARDVIAGARSVYRRHGIAPADPHEYIQGLLQASISTTNARALSTGWRPTRSSFVESAERAYLELTGFGARE